MAQVSYMQLCMGAGILGMLFLYPFCISLHISIAYIVTEDKWGPAETNVLFVFVSTLVLRQTPCASYTRLCDATLQGLTLYLSRGTFSGSKSWKFSFCCSHNGGSHTAWSWNPYYFLFLMLPLGHVVKKKYDISPLVMPMTPSYIYLFHTVWNWWIKWSSELHGMSKRCSALDFPRLSIVKW